MRDVTQMLVAEFVSINGGVLAGFLLAGATGILEKIPGVLILLPAFLELRGNIAGSLAARLGTGLHLGVIRGRWKRENVRRNVLASFLLGIAVSAVIGAFAWFLSLLIGIESVGWKLILLSVLAALISNVIGISLTTYLTLALYEKGYDPDDIMGPVVTTIGDVVSVLSLILAGLVVVRV